MRINQILSIMRQTESVILRKINSKYYFRNFTTFNRKLEFSPNYKKRKLYNQTTSNSEIYEEINNKIKNEQFNTRYLLYKESGDYLLKRITNSVSVQEVFDIFNFHSNRFNYKHLTQTIFVLYDLKTIFIEMNRSNTNPSDFINELNENETWHQILNAIKENRNEFTNESLCYVTYYLSQIGIDVESDLIQGCLEEIKQGLIQNFSLKIASIYMKTVFLKSNLRNYFQIQELVPLIYDSLGTCYEVNELEHLTICLHKLNKYVTNEILEKYKDLVRNFIKNDQLSGENYRTIIEILALLNYPQRFDNSTDLIVKCILLLKSHFNLLNIDDLVLVYEIFKLIQEPAIILNELQRNALRHFQQLLNEDLSKEKLKLFSSIMYFSSPINRINFKHFLSKYVDESVSTENVLLLRSILSFMKISDEKLCENYWNKALKILQSESKKDQIDLSVWGVEYLRFNTDVNDYRNRNFENEIISQMKHELIKSNFLYLSKKLSNLLNFVLIYSNDEKLLGYFVEKLNENWENLNHIDYLKISATLYLFLNDSNDRKYLKYKYVEKINELLTKMLRKQLKDENVLEKVTILLKACVYRKELKDNLVNELLMKCKEIDNFSSKTIDNILFYLYSSDNLIPELIDKFTDYVISHPENILGFNVEKILFYCYLCGYQPKNSEKFFDSSINILIRDQERLSGLSFIQSALALSYFNKLPATFIKSIFNTEFLDKLDIELANCYSKDSYPYRVRFSLMQLNRSVCLGYPQFNVPWFHQKFVKEFKKIGLKDELFRKRFKDYLNRAVGKTDEILENITTPYGYHIDYVVNLNSEEKIAGKISNKTKKLAIILLPQNAYTKGVVNLKGKYQLERKHLEILGYQIVMISHSDYINLFYTADRIDYLSNIIWPERLCKNISN